jgi:hypothetical protein
LKADLEIIHEGIDDDRISLSNNSEILIDTCHPNVPKQNSSNQLLSKSPFKTNSIENDSKDRAGTFSRRD